MTSVAWVGLIAAVMAALAAMLGADVLTVKGRLRRALDKELTIADKMPDGPLKDEMQRMAERHAAELLVRDGQYAAILALGLVGISLTFANAFVLFKKRAAGSPVLSAPPELWLAAGFAALLGVALMWEGIRRRYSRAASKKVDDGRRSPVRTARPMGARRRTGR